YEQSDTLLRLAGARPNRNVSGDGGQLPLEVAVVGLAGEFVVVAWSSEIVALALDQDRHAFRNFYRKVEGSLHDVAVVAERRSVNKLISARQWRHCLFRIESKCILGAAVVQCFVECLQAW